MVLVFIRYQISLKGKKMSRTIRKNPNGKYMRTPRTTGSKRELSFKDEELFQYGIRPVSKFQFVDAYSDLVISAIKERSVNAR